MLYKSATLSFNGSISSSLIAKRFFRLGLNRPSTYVETEFDKKWKKLSSEEQDALAKDFLPLQSQDWKTLTMEQKKNLYTIAFGVPEIRDPNEKWKVFAGTLAAIGVGLGAFYIVRLFASPPSPTYTNEYYEQTKEYMKKQGAHPIDRSFDK